MKRWFALIFLGVVLGLILWRGDAARFLIPIQKFFFSFSSNISQSPSSSEDDLSLLKTKIAFLEEENSVLKKSLQIIEQESSGIAAPVIGLEMQRPTILLIGKGEKDGVEVGSAVISPSGTLIGKIITVHQSRSLVRLVTDNKSKFSGVVANAPSPVSGVVEGVHGLGIRLKLIPLRELVNKGDLVMTAGQEIGIPRGLPIGRVEEITEMPGVPLKEAILAPLVALDQLLVVIILKEGGISGQ